MEDCSIPEQSSLARTLIFESIHHLGPTEEMIELSYVEASTAPSVDSKIRKLGVQPQ